MKWQEVEICECDCHKEGIQLLHFMACCQFCYEKYLTVSGEIIPEKLQPLLRESHLQSLKRQGEKNGTKNENE
jgi:hypothetical protein